MVKKSPGKRRKSSDSAKAAEKEEVVEEVKTETVEELIEVLSEESGDENAAELETEDKEVEKIEEPSDSLPVSPMLSDGKYRNKQRCLVLCSRGVTARYRHLLEDIRTLLPHHKKESKLDPGSDGMGQAVNDIADMRSCNTVLFLECRKHADAYLWMGRVGEKSGPSVRFHVTNIHTMDEMRLTGNCMKGSRPVLTFDESFDRVGHLKVLKELFVDVFGTPRGHPKSKPFVDRVMAFYYADKKVRYTNRLCENTLS
jgi:ribosome biogenesis protein BRX1